MFYLVFPEKPILLLMGVEVHEYNGEKQEMDYTADLDQNGMRDKG